MRICPNWMTCESAKGPIHRCGHAKPHKSQDSCNEMGGCNLPCLRVKSKDEDLCELDDLSKAK